MQARLILADGTIFSGKSFGSERESIGEVVFNTGMTGYQEVLSDPSYCGQMVTMTYPLFGNYGISRDDFETISPFIYGFIVREAEKIPSNWRAQSTLSELLMHYNIPGISSIDTRMLTRKLRYHGVMKGMITTSQASLTELMEKINAYEYPTNQIATVSTAIQYRSPGTEQRIVVMDFGAKNGIVRDLVSRGCDVIVVPHDTSADEIRRHAPDGVLLSNGPGDPKNALYAIATIRSLVEEAKIPIFGICLGHQLIALACGADTEKLKFGHRGSNHPVKDLTTGRCYLTSQNHGYTVNEASVIGTKLVITHVNNNDQTVEGLRHHTSPVFSVQYHPEASPGPWDSSYLFDDFLTMIQTFKQNNPTPPSQTVMVSTHHHTQAPSQKSIGGHAHA